MKNVYIDKLADIVKYNNTHHRTIKMKLVDVKSITYIDFGQEKIDKDPQFKVCDDVRMSKYKNIIAKGHGRNCSDVFIIKKKLEILCGENAVISDLNDEEIVTFYKKGLQKTDQKEFGIEKVIKRKVDKLYIKWKGYDNSLIIRLIKKILLYKMSYFPEPYTCI